MRVLLLAADKEFKGIGTGGVVRYICEIYKNMKRLAPGSIEKRGYKELPLAYAGFSPFIHSMWDDLGKYDIIHNLEAKPIYLMRKGRAKICTTIHDFRPLLRPEMTDADFASARRILGFYLVLKLGARLALKSDYLFTNSTQTRDEAVGLGFDRRKIFVVNHGLDERFMRGAAKEKKNKNFRIGYVGLIGKNKNVAFAVRAVKTMKDKDIEFEIWGKPEFDYEKIAGLAKSDRRIRMKGYAPEERLVDIYDSFDAFVHPSLYEGLGLPILEAQARGKPVILYKHAKIPEEVRRYCFIAEDEAHMARILQGLKDNGYDAKLKRRATEYARSFTWERTARETLRAYKSILKS
jgi:glycosyltransferase involved in cell wall biosynthesis